MKSTPPSVVPIGQKFGDSASLMIGKINSMDASADKPFAGGARIDSFQNIVFTDPPSGTLQPYLLGSMIRF
jgi:hypothetical protein